MHDINITKLYCKQHSHLLNIDQYQDQSLVHNWFPNCVHSTLRTLIMMKFPSSSQVKGRLHWRTVWRPPFNSSCLWLNSCIPWKVSMLEPSPFFTTVQASLHYRTWNFSRQDVNDILLTGTGLPFKLCQTTGTLLNALWQNLRM